MREPVGTTGHVPIGDGGGVPGAPAVPDEAAMAAEILDDRRRERFLLRVALVALLAMAIVISVRIWG